jgi:Domain of unknown function (DUF4157)
MTRQNALQTQQQTALNSILSRGGILQRKCESCGQHTISGGECSDCNKNKSGLQRKLMIGASNDPLELEADRVADQVMSASPNSVVNSAPPRIQRFTGQADMVAPASVDSVLSSHGSPLEPGLQQDMGQRFGHDFSRVRVHTDAAAARSARDANANAYTVGHSIVFGKSGFAPRTKEGQRLIAHELTHVIQQSKSNGAMLQRAINPEDVAVEMNGREFELSSSFTSSNSTHLAQGTSVWIVSWVNADTNVWALTPPLLAPINIPKTLLRPVKPNGTKLDPYSTGLDAQANAVNKNQADLVGKTGNEKVRLEKLLVNRNEVLNRKLIQETMFNRFDPIIAREVATANAAHGFTGSAALNPDLVKAMIFQESEMGTSGTHMEVPPSHPVKTRFNLGQVIDSSGMALFTMLESEQPTFITTFSLTNLRSDLAAARAEKSSLEAILKQKQALNPTQVTRLAELKRLYGKGKNWEVFIWQYKASGKTTGFADAIASFFQSSAPAKNMDYEFWIHMMVFWLFKKKTPSRTWLEAIKAYNGAGPKAEKYRNDIERRATNADVAATAGRPFTPTR